MSMMVQLCADARKQLLLGRSRDAVRGELIAAGLDYGEAERVLDRAEGAAAPGVGPTARASRFDHVPTMSEDRRRYRRRMLTGAVLFFAGLAITVVATATMGRPTFLGIANMMIGGTAMLWTYLTQ